MHEALLEKLINPPRHSGNHLYKHLSEQDQVSILEHAKEHGLNKAARQFNVSEDRVKRIFTKYSEELPTHASKKPKGQRLPASVLPTLEKLTRTDFKGRLHTYSYMGHLRTVEGYTLDEEPEEHVLVLHTRTKDGIERDVKYLFREAHQVQYDFVRWNE